MFFKGKVFVFGNNVNTDEIIAARYLNISTPAELVQYFMEDIRPDFGKRDDLKGSILVAGDNFGCGSSREHAPQVIKAAGFACVVAKSFARIFMRNAINIGLPIVELEDPSNFQENDMLEVDLQTGRIVNVTRNTTYTCKSYPPFLQEIIQAGGWLEYAKTQQAAY